MAFMRPGVRPPSAPPETSGPSLYDLALFNSWTHFRMGGAAALFHERLPAANLQALPANQVIS